MASFLQKFKDLFFKPDASDQERMDRWKKEVDEADRLNKLHREARKQTKMLSHRSGDQHMDQFIKQKNKTLSSNF